jgi:hypothetical protein
MAKKRAPKVKNVPTPAADKPIRLVLSAGDHARIKRAARQRGLSLAAYARQAVLERLRADERETP